MSAIFEEVSTSLVDRHFSHNITVVVARSFIRKNVRNGKERTGSKATLNFVLNLVSQGLNATRLDKFFFAHLIECLFEVRDGKHSSQLEDRVRMSRAELFSMDFKGQNFTVNILGISSSPGSITD